LDKAGAPVYLFLLATLFAIASTLIFHVLLCNYVIS